MFCGNCGVELEESAVFCQKCGTKVAGIAKSTTQINPATVENTITTKQMVEVAPYTRKKGPDNIVVIVVVAIFVVVVVIGAVAGIALQFAAPRSLEKFAVEEKSNIVDNAGVVIETQAEEPILQQSQDMAYYDIHRYELVVEDVSWTQAWQACRQKGGYLVHINSQEEYDAITEQIFAEEKQNIIFWLGAIRGREEEDYRWVDASGAALDEVINNNPVYDGFWMNGEPSFQGDNLQETCVDMFYRSSEERFVWNDVQDDLIGAVSSYAGKVGYICEYED